MEQEAINQYSKDIIDKQGEVIKSLVGKLDECLKKKVKLQSQLKERGELLDRCYEVVKLTTKDRSLLDKLSNLKTN